MKKLLAWWQKDKRYIILCKAVLCGILPLLGCLVYCAMQGRGIGSVYLPASEWNDELFYYKQVEGIVRYGYPQGFFGFNESHALKLSFAAWSPVLVFPWILVGLLFGWGLMTPVITNIFLLSLAFVLFVLLVKPTWKQVGILVLLFCLYTPFVRYMLSGMPEVICFSLLILFYSLAVNYLKRESGIKLALLFALAGVMTLMRPYLILFLFLPAFLWFRKNKVIGTIGSVCVIGVVFGGYAMIKHYLGAEYFAPLFFTDWVDAFFDQGLFGGIYYTLRKLKWMGTSFKEYTVDGFVNGRAAGAFFGCYLTMLFVLLVQTVSEWNGWRKENRSRKQNKETKIQMPAALVINGHLTLCFVGMLIALLLMYKLTEGSKHLLTFLAVGLVIVSLMKTKFYRKAILIGASFAFLLGVKATDPYDYQVPFATEEAREQMDTWKEVLSSQLVLTKENVPNFENSVIWTLNDRFGEEWKSSKWQILYSLPAGFGISCCEYNFVSEHLEELSSRYLTLASGGELDERCREIGYTEIYRDEDLVLYQRY